VKARRRALRQGRPGPRNCVWRASRRRSWPHVASGRHHVEL